MAEINNGTLTQIMLKRCKMTCGEYIDLISTWERILKERQIQNSKRARSTEFELFKTPSATQNNQV